MPPHNLMELAKHSTGDLKTEPRKRLWGAGGRKPACQKAVFVLTHPGSLSSN